MSALIHTAGAYVDFVQHCIICGEIICDDTIAGVPIEGAPRGFEEGEILVDGHFRATARYLDQKEIKNIPHCKP